MREIKFRAWNKNSKKMNDDPAAMKDIVSINWELSDKNPDNKPYIWMQYTGIKDKNGKEIYEGDILSHKILDEEPLFYVKYDVAGFWLFEREPDDVASYFLDTENMDYEVIGNIYENPALVTE